MDGICYFKPGVQRSSRRGKEGGRINANQRAIQRLCESRKKEAIFTTFRNRISSRPLLPRTLPPFRLQRVTRYLARQTRRNAVPRARQRRAHHAEITQS